MSPLALELLRERACPGVCPRLTRALEFRLVARLVARLLARLFAPGGVPGAQRKCTRVSIPVERGGDVSFTRLMRGCLASY